MLFKKEEITSFEKITVRLSGMRCIDEYEVICKGEKSEVSQYLVYYTRDERELVRRGECSTEEIITLLNDCKVLRWDGFSGPNPRGVRDGHMLLFTAEINGRKIRAEGSNNYPKRYREFMDRINKILYGGDV